MHRGNGEYSHSSSSRRSSYHCSTTSLISEYFKIFYPYNSAWKVKNAESRSLLGSSFPDLRTVRLLHWNLPRVTKKSGGWTECDGMCDYRRWGWIHHFDPATKQESMHWKSPQSPVKKLVCQVKSMNMVMLTLFFDAQEVIYQHVVPHHTTINSLYCCKVLRTLKRHANKNMPNLKKIGFCTTTTLSHTLLSLSENFQKKEIKVFAHLVYGPNLALMRFLGFWSRKMGIAQ